MNKPLLTRAEAKAQGLKRFFSGEPCKNGHVAERFARNNTCVECHRECNRKWRKKPEKRERRLEQQREWQRKLREKPDYREQQREYDRKNATKCAARNAKRRAVKMRRTPAWADLDLIEVFYATARKMTEETGTSHEVDHIIPLQGDIVSGLHVATNLQILTKSDNSAKRNKYVMDGPCFDDLPLAQQGASK